MSKMITVNVKGRVIGGDRPLICTPIVAKSGNDIAKAADEMAALQPDIVEWRVDYLEEVEDISAVIGYLETLRKKLGDYPIIFTCRIDKEGGARSIPQEKRFELMKKVIETKQIDIIDLELCNGEAAIRDIQKTAKANGVYVILSNHEFKQTPPMKTIVERLIKAQEMGADIAKIAVMPNTIEDVLSLLAATNEMREKHARIPLITMSMSGKGLISRVGGGIFGSAITFGAGKAASAPGQIAVSELRTVLNILQKNM